MKDTVKTSGVRKSLGQLRREAQEQAYRESQEGSGVDPWACPSCGCKDWRIANSHEYGGPRKRQRICRNCGHELPTLEVPVPAGHTLKVIPIKTEVA